VLGRIVGYASDESYELWYGRGRTVIRLVAMLRHGRNFRRVDSDLIFGAMLHALSQTLTSVYRLNERLKRFRYFLPEDTGALASQVVRS
jgi:hypothetical protein